ncbi:glycerol-3-phosphate 1-O-acyltransferase PlsY [Campylobacter ureolyticus]|uniref:Glycerol-3-phosphate acyltransferase n=1 Tax=Campylobacter ureolyticus TaxID=827 RepID=A0A9Q4PTL8_9BACT|nr:glycerol-3-phosphate 1-O-acyltransferase PlsY [Campylobacter ureolyticus]MCZ6102719.1 glycerol-3-phosphate 1-O-acyltransferase PlsY [Campylobacter ureolyticus]MCZ6134872.1 glycerol-3-phosphate 1-O-acyltransferase PlsY [Campylobacter ureolyticus]MCZ6161498.1 glycerol-3-phosphate 1-O-acyltransferase PlsY [Campylobacter ureolyticus]MCZ6170218.1 glycerol-3-phosphate 1-O-acyltransferase PlsY [Campylobacter ureolyticus]MDU4981231.1 glycerol-3-phosphate 1-O-acyltransferase PlsY [Campylobacter ureo
MLYLTAYLIASIPFGVIIVKSLYSVDITKEGSKSIGATNVYRVLKNIDLKNAKKIAIITIICDVLKGFLPIIIAKFAGVDENVLWMMAVMAVLGHCFSAFLKFEGGKGVATSYGVFAAFLPIEVALSVVVWFFVGKFIKVSSIASLSGIFTFLILSLIIHPQILPINTHAPIIIIVFIVFYKHIPNIKRLIFKEEKQVL